MQRLLELSNCQVWMALRVIIHGSKEGVREAVRRRRASAGYSLNTFFSGTPKLGALGAHVSIDFRTIAGDGRTAWPEMM
jgi:hypothetical protein